MNASNGNRWVRQLHRWLAIAFTVTVIATTFGVLRAEPILWMSYLPLLPLALLFFSGLYLFALPYLTRRRARRRVVAQG